MNSYSIRSHVPAPAHCIWATVTLLLVRISICHGAQEHMLLNNPPSLQAEGLTVFTFNSPEFKSEVAKLLTREQLQKASPFLPYSLVVINNTRRPIYSFTVIYTFPGWISESGKQWQDIISPSAPSMERLQESGRRTLVTPVSDFLAASDVSGKIIIQPHLDEGLEEVIRVFIKQHQYKRIQTSMDSIIFGDGTLVGPDIANRLDEVNTRLKADGDLLAELETLHGSALRNRLLLISESIPDPRETYASRKATAAKQFLYVMETLGEAKLIEHLAAASTGKWLGGESKRVRRKEQ